MQALPRYNWRNFVAGISSTLGKVGRSSAPSKEGDVSARHLLRMGALAARAAHDLGSPLTTMAVLVDELRLQLDLDDLRKLDENLRIMSDQIEACRRILCALEEGARGEG